MIEKLQKNKPTLLLIYDLIFCGLAIIAVYISLCDISSGCTDFQLMMDNIITVIFIFDYVIRLIIAKDKKSFFKANILDLIAIIPFNSLFKICRVFKFVKILKVLKILKFARFIAYFGRLYKRIKFFFDINGLKYMVIASVICILAGGIAIHFIEGTPILDGLWWSFVTTTTVGYGDISPATNIGRIVAAVLMIVGIGLIGSLTSTITALFFQKHEHKNKDASTKGILIHTIQSQLDNFDDLSEDDINTICNTLKSLKK